MAEETFICPECGSDIGNELLMVETLFEPNDVWSGVLQRYRCKACRSVIPAHLAERWDNRSVVAARTEWQNIYRATQPEWD